MTAFTTQHFTRATQPAQGSGVLGRLSALEFAMLAFSLALIALVTVIS